MDNVQLYPPASSVFADPLLEAYFKPLLSYKHDGNYIHLLSTDGLYCLNSCKFSENGFWGFKYADGRYEFLGDLGVFGKNNAGEVYSYLKEDFYANSALYLSERLKQEAYWNRIEKAILTIADFDAEQDVKYYAEACYSYFLSRYNYEQTGKFYYVMELVAGYGHDEEPILLDNSMMDSILDEFFMNMKYLLNYDYEITPEMVVCATESFRYTYYGGVSFAFLDKYSDNVYILEYYT